ncbi:hypothetical protein BC940DRAFT_144497 [Gongronella butleri]|nr:hypothetical protein BC940DRAFT_144497 [Gongronella butleri]
MQAPTRTRRSWTRQTRLSRWKHAIAAGWVSCLAADRSALAAGRRPPFCVSVHSSFSADFAHWADPARPAPAAPDSTASWVPCRAACFFSCRLSMARPTKARQNRVAMDLCALVDPAAASLMAFSNWHHACPFCRPWMCSPWVRCRPCFPSFWHLCPLRACLCHSCLLHACLDRSSLCCPCPCYSCPWHRPCQTIFYRGRRSNHPFCHLCPFSTIVLCPCRRPSFPIPSQYAQKVLTRLEVLHAQVPPSATREKNT